MSNISNPNFMKVSSQGYNMNEVALGLFNFSLKHWFSESKYFVIIINTRMFTKQDLLNHIKIGVKAILGFLKTNERLFLVKIIVS